MKIPRDLQHSLGPMTATEVPGATGLMVRLRAATANCHRELEDWIAIDRRFASTSNYQNYLVQLLPLFRGYENALARLAWNDAGLDFDSRRKVPFIEQDLRYFSQLDQARKEVPFPTPSTVAAGFGTLYVLEGSTLGGRVILERLGKRGIEPESGAAFFNGYGERTKSMWKTFQDVATAYCFTDESMQEACTAAIATFDHYRHNITPL
jgi:heme oxygenase